ncbi:hypothetical protein K7432_004833 [Basidiobolus ranarum]|uniref:F-box domain-containing protein n=1 Tax=Basidiobolus ranarum TaxID=34480 RepID=A0ABR2WXI0_9FUNG
MLAELPLEILDQICTQLSALDLVHLAATNHHFYQVILNSDCWNHVDFSCVSNLKKGTTEVCSSPADCILEEALSCGLVAAARLSIRELVLDYTNVTTKSIDRALRLCPQLHSLSIRHCKNIELVSLVCFFEKLANTDILECPRTLSKLQYFGHPTETELNEVHRGTISWLLPRLRLGLFKFTSNPNFHVDILSENETSGKNARFCSSCGEGRCRQCYNPRESIVKTWCQACQAFELVCNSCRQEYSCMNCEQYICKLHERLALTSYVCHKCHHYSDPSCIEETSCSSCFKSACSRNLNDVVTAAHCELSKPRMLCDYEFTSTHS